MMYQAKRAIIMAAGIGQRMQPLTLQTPKPLITVHGNRMIDTVIRALLHNGIREIYVVTGYLKEQFSILEQEYSEVTILENPDYDTCNNISSLFAAREYIPESIILDGDQIIYNPNILLPEFERSGYCCAWTEDKTEEWLLTVEKGIVTACSRTGGEKGWQLYSVSFWNKEDGLRLQKHIEQEFLIKGSRNIYWDDVALFCYPDEYQLGIRRIEKEDIIEIDNLKELQEIDTAYQNLE